MFRKTLVYMSILLYLNLLVFCTNGYIPVKIQADAPAIGAKKMPEVKITKNDGTRIIGKIQVLEDDEFTILPHPYLNVTQMRIRLAEINKIERIHKDHRALKSMAMGFGMTFITVGLLGFLASEYDEDYQIALAGSALLGGIVGLVGLAVGAIGQKSNTYDFTQWPSKKRKQAVKDIMGY